MSMSDEPQLYYIPYDSFVADVRVVAELIAGSDWQPDFVIGIGRGGLVPARLHLAPARPADALDRP